jgi:crotonobetainyl-CoA:carnitine CoA-transferase CaiB-like acyl-CoA transferase
VNRFAPTCPCNFYRTTDGWVGVTALTPGQWAALAGAIGRPDLARDEGFRTTYQRLARADEVDALLAPVFATRSSAEWVALGDGLRIPITPALRPAELPTSEHWRFRGSFRPLDDQPGSPEGPTLPFRFSFDGARAPRPAGGAHGPLTGVRVADFSMGWAGPLATRYLADLGADVLKIESHGRPDWWRGWEVVEAMDPPPTEVQRNFMAVNRGKRGLDLDLAGARGKAAAVHIVQLADVVIDNQGPGVMDRLGLGPADQRRLRPSVISISMPPFGRTGPLSGLRAYGSTVEQASGMPFVNGYDAWPPCHQHVAYGDAVAGLYGAAAALIGLWARDPLGGAEIDLCQVECLFQLGAAAIIAEQARGAPLPREGSRRPGMSPCCVVRAAGEDEAWLAVAVDRDAAWPALCRAIGRDDLAADPALAGLAGRKAREDDIEAAVAGWARTTPPAGAAEALQRAGVAAAPVLATSQLCGDLHLAATDFWVLQHRRYVGDHLTPHAPFRFDGARPVIRRAAPVLGEHTQEVLDELGFEAVTP